ncbi:Uncharacterised protein [Bordetella pertussis]|nr:Uncharacterised protein [Bordetella pertussis]CFL75766.1 Uncharacterised protein [Bordetella pertussis]CFL85231.1 Uncharacterised protein [Bordetella pertussis]CFL90019.1 Uncharacterised protein [Bordetella pertussis]CFM13807.1 Uncharacterised protein [Bordetella pertussis]
MPADTTPAPLRLSGPRWTVASPSAISPCDDTVMADGEDRLPSWRTPRPESLDTSVMCLPYMAPAAVPSIA